MAWVNYTRRLKPKDMIPTPWMVAMALQADGWYLRSDIIWSKPNPMPESVTDRPTKSHEYVFLLSKGSRYFYDADAIREPLQDYKVPEVPVVLDGGNKTTVRASSENLNTGRGRAHYAAYRNPAGANKRSVWTVATQPFAQAHFATFPPALIEPCVLAGSPPKCCGECGAPWQRVVERATPPQVAPSALDRYGNGDAEVHRKVGGAYQEWLDQNPRQTVGWEPTCECIPIRGDDNGYSLMLADENAVPSKVLDPFAGAGTVGVVCGWHARDFIGIELNPEYAQMAEERIALEGRPGGKPNGHERPNVHDDQLGFEVA